jgi:hypothetical protein
MGFDLKWQKKTLNSVYTNVEKMTQDRLLNAKLMIECGMSVWIQTSPGRLPCMSVMIKKRASQDMQ